MLQGDVIAWILSTNIIEHQSQRVRGCAACLVREIALFCPRLVLQNKDTYIGWIKNSFELPEHDRIIYFLIQSVQNLYTKSSGSFYDFDRDYSSFMNLFINKTLDKNFLAGGFSAAVADAINDIT